MVLGGQCESVVKQNRSDKYHKWTFINDFLQCPFHEAARADDRVFAIRFRDGENHTKILLWKMN